MKRMSPSKSTQLLKSQGAIISKKNLVHSPKKNQFEDARGSLPEIKTSMILANQNHILKEKFTPMNKYQSNLSVLSRKQNPIILSTIDPVSK